MGLGIRTLPSSLESTHFVSILEAAIGGLGAPREKNWRGRADARARSNRF